MRGIGSVTRRTETGALQSYGAALFGGAMLLLIVVFFAARRHRLRRGERKLTMNWLLSTIVFLPLVGGIVVMLLPETLDTIGPPPSLRSASSWLSLWLYFGLSVTGGSFGDVLNPAWAVSSSLDQHQHRRLPLPDQLSPWAPTASACR